MAVTKYKGWLYGDAPPTSWREVSDIMKARRVKPRSIPKSSYETKIDEIKKLIEDNKQ